VSPEITLATLADLPRCFEVWESSVRATHTFLTEADLQALIPLVKAGLAAFEPLHVVRDPSGEAVAFMGVAEGTVEMLFVHAEHRGQGLGHLLLTHALMDHAATRVDVNEQNPQALRFYERHGFRVVGRSPLDGQGKPFPILHLALSQASS
jgi:putative acetyltransferase